MIKEDKINIKLEIGRDKSSDKLNLIVHFNTHTPNFIIDKNEYYWTPTIEEKDLMNEVFDLLNFDKKIRTQKNYSSEQAEKKEESKEPEPVLNEKLNYLHKSQSNIKEEKYDEFPPIKTIEQLTN